MSDLPYDPEARRDTPLALKLKERIRREGPITIAQYMDACLNDPEFGYYRTQTAIGAKGDFVTAPEISQVFGELIGLWAAVVWQQMGSPERFNLVELGPGRGTLMADAIRATRIVPGFHAAARVALVERNPVLIAAQRDTLSASASAMSWHADLEDVAGGPTIVLANEFLDTIPAGQAIKVREDAGPGCAALQERTRAVGLDERGRLTFQAGAVQGSRPMPHSEIDDIGWNDLPDGSIYEFQDFAQTVDAIGRRAAADPLAGLFLDYGYMHRSEGADGSSLQAVRAHGYEHPLTSPGEADLTVHVNFGDFASKVRARCRGVAVDGPVTQGSFLGSLGIMQRASKLMAANPDKAAAIEMGVARLMAVPGMGDRFKAIGVRCADLPPLPGLSEP